MNTKYDSRRGDELIIEFPRSDRIAINFSQAYQDLFALTMLRGKESGKYIEVGANDPSNLNNTVLLETQFKWKGISVEIDQAMVNKFNNHREQPCYQADATTFDWVQAFKDNRWRTKRIDYASVDCEPPAVTLAALQNLPHDDYRFSVITFETDVYKDGSQWRDASREFLNGLGYQLVAADVCNGNNPYEDWWVDPEVITESVYEPFISTGAEARDLFING